MRQQLLIVMVLLIVNTGYACSCKGPLSIEDEYRNSEIVIHGKVIEINYVSLASTIDSLALSNIYDSITNDLRKFINMPMIIETKVKIIKSFKGNFISDTVTIYTGSSSASCGFTRFKVGQDFILYGTTANDFLWIIDSNRKLPEAPEKINTYWTNHCRRTTEVNKLEIDGLEEIIKKG